ncbi:hypothetical protein [Streptomyces prunicolor]|uniref:hypothetical protein n=1 Tax=Streptomyces prunicolor TaxID=67348 RepID=UPI0003A50CE0|nr:hypothetical protein [Streptomyces prunicolor]
MAVSRSEMSVVLDGFAGQPLGVVGPLDGSWVRSLADVAVVGRRISGEVVAVDLEAGRVRMTMAATENVDEGPAHPICPGVGFITYPELS